MSGLRQNGKPVVQPNASRIFSSRPIVDVCLDCYFTGATTKQQREPAEPSHLPRRAIKLPLSRALSCRKTRPRHGEREKQSLPYCCSVDSSHWDLFHTGHGPLIVVLALLFWFRFFFFFFNGHSTINILFLLVFSLSASSSPCDYILFHPFPSSSSAFPFM